MYVYINICIIFFLITPFISHFTHNTRPSLFLTFDDDDDDYNDDDNADDVDDDNGDDDNDDDNGDDD
jgi:hypothetical protein